eukprot:m.172868 g.172868  ORF g.172868 m.172868 type:complete len:93 (+) comp16521_c12_seq1:226-504(+)
MVDLQAPFQLSPQHIQSINSTRCTITMQRADMQVHIHFPSCLASPFLVELTKTPKRQEHRHAKEEIPLHRDAEPSAALSTDACVCPAKATVL